MTRTIEECRERLDQAIRELATVTQGAAWRMAITSIYDENDEAIGRHISRSPRPLDPPSHAQEQPAP